MVWLNIWHSFSLYRHIYIHTHTFYIIIILNYYYTYCAKETKIWYWNFGKSDFLCALCYLSTSSLNYTTLWKGFFFSYYIHTLYKIEVRFNLAVVTLVFDRKITDIVLASECAVPQWEKYITSAQVKNKFHFLQVRHNEYL